MKTRVLLASTPDAPTNTAMLEHKCTKCEASTIVSASVEKPFCISCGTGEVVSVAQANTQKPMASFTKDELAAVQCIHCATHLILPIEDIAAHTTHSIGVVHCPACSAQVAFEAPSLIKHDLHDEDEEPNHPKGSMAAKRAMMSEHASTDDDYDDELEDEEGDDLEDDYLIEDEEVASILKPLPESAEFVVCDNNTILCIANTEVIAHAAHDKPDAFVAACKVATEEASLSSVLADKRWTRVTQEVTAKLADSLEEASKAASDTLAEKTALIASDTKQSLALAAFGMNRGFFTKENPLQSALAKVLSDKGVSNAAQLASEALASAGDDYVEALCETTASLMEKPLDVRNELSKTIMDIELPKNLPSLSPLEQQLANPVVEASVSSTIKPITKATSKVSELARKSTLFYKG